MAGGTEVTKVEGWLDGASVAAALLVLPAVYMQTASESLERWGDVLSVGIWLYFVAEILVLLRLAPDNVEWLKSHVVEFAIVVVSCPLFLFLFEGQNLFAIGPLLAVTRIFRLVKFVKAVKLAKLLKSDKIVRDNASISGLVELVVGVLVTVLALGILGMLVDDGSHNLAEGLRFWLDGLPNISGVNWPVLVGSCVVVGGLVYRISQSAKSITSDSV